MKGRLLLAAALGFVVLCGGLVGWLAPSEASFTVREHGFDWELASIFGTAVGTVLLALATAYLAQQTRVEAEATRRSVEASTRPILVDAPRGVFIVEEDVFPSPSRFRTTISGAASATTRRRDRG